MSCTKMDRPSDIEVLCRLCLVKDQVHIPIFEEQGDIRQIFLKISCCLPVSISREDNLPKKICDNCSNKLDSLYEFWNTSVNAEKTLLSWLGQAGVKYTDNAISAVVQQITKPETEIKIEDETIEDGEVEAIEINDKDDEAEEIDDGEMEDFDDGEVEDIEDDEPPPPKRARRSAALKAQETLANISDDDEDEEFDTAELVTEVKEESDESEGEVKDPSILNAVPGTSANDQPGPSGLGKNGPDAPFVNASTNYEHEELCLKQEPLDVKEDFYDVSNDDINFKIKGNLHQSTVLDRKPNITCRICEKIFKNEQSLRIHIRRLHSENNINLKCKSCDKSFKNRDYLLEHTKRVHSGNHQKLKCDLCGKTFNYKNILYYHIKRVHSKNYERVKCELCDKSFKQKAYLRLHIKRQHSLNCDKFKCEFCDKFFKNKDYVRVHYQRIHSGKCKEFKCEFCDKSFEYKLDLCTHIKTLHPEIQVTFYNCEFCDKSFKFKFNLYRHIRSLHSGNHERFQCEFCDKNFKHKRGLLIHNRKRHTGNN